MTPSAEIREIIIGLADPSLDPAFDDGRNFLQRLFELADEVERMEQELTRLTQEQAGSFW